MFGHSFAIMPHENSSKNFASSQFWQVEENYGLCVIVCVSLLQSLTSQT